MNQSEKMRLAGIRTELMLAVKEYRKGLSKAVRLARNFGYKVAVKRPILHVDIYPRKGVLSR